MSLWVEAQVEERDDASAARTGPHGPRRGLHLSSVIRSYVSTVDSAFVVRAQRAGKMDRPFMEGGEVFEDTLEFILGQRDHGDGGFRPEPRVLDGIACSPDRAAPARTVGDILIEEHKMTWKSMRQGIEHEKFWSWWMQLAAYMWVWETTQGRFRVFWACGDYSPPLPQRRIYDVTLQPDSLKRNWETLRRHAERAGLYEKYGVEPPGG